MIETIEKYEPARTCPDQLFGHVGETAKERTQFDRDRNRDHALDVLHDLHVSGFYLAGVHFRVGRNPVDI